MFYRKTNIPLSASKRLAPPVSMSEEDQQVPEGCVIAASRAHMNPDEFNQAMHIIRAPTTLLKDEKTKHKLAESRHLH